MKSVYKELAIYQDKVFADLSTSEMDTVVTIMS